MLIKSILQGRFIRHPLHPIIVHLTAGLWIGSLIMDIVYLTSGAPGAATGAYYAMLIGLCSVVLALPTGLAEFLSIPARTRPKRIAATHATMNISLTFVYLVNFLWRMQPDGSAPFAVSTGQFVLSLVSVTFLAGSGYLGGLLVFNFGVGYRGTDLEDKSRDSRRAA